HKFMITMMILCSGIGGILYGYDVGVFSGAMPFIKQLLFPHLSTQAMTIKIGILGGAVFGGGLIGTLITGYLSDRFGRRTMIIAASLLFISGIILILFVSTFWELLAARIVLGIAVGVVSVAVPSYLTEIAPTAIRGKSVAIFQVFLTLGILLAYLVDLYFTPSGNWRAMFAVIAIPTFILLISMIVLPESPRWLVSHIKIKKAMAVLGKTRSPVEAHQEMQEIIASLKEKRSHWADLFQKRLALPLFLAIFVAVFNQFTAINAFLQYAPSIFKSAGLASNVGAISSTIYLGSVNFIVTIISLFLVDHVGRRLLLIAGTAGIVLSYVFLAVTSGMAFSAHTHSILALIGLLSFVACFAIGPGVVVWLVLSELFPTEIRGKGIALSLFASSLSAWLVTTLFLPLKNYLGLSGSYWLFAACTVIYCVVVLVLLPETKQKSLEQIQRELQQRSKKIWH
ncbi:MAG: sugar porter family MFS transporter, partial [Gammaproteobacteria bacterium]|nr:sugar porter family MFS transporter [Gammaproteobacteria bacterium]